MSKFDVKHDTGYGLIPRRVMRDKSLSIEAKAIYSYLASFAGNTGRSFPSTTLMQGELNISKNRLFKYLKELREKNVISVEREKQSNGKFGKNVYYLHNSVNKPSLHFGDMENVDMGNADMGNRDTNSNNLNSNNYNSNNINKEQTKKKEKSNQTKNITKDKIGLVIKKWNDVASKYEKIPKILYINRDTQRYKMLNARYKEVGLEMILKAISSIERSRFLRGQSNADWAIRFDWFVAPSNFIKVIEGNYLDSKDDMVANHRVATKDDLARDENGNLLKF